VNVDLSGDDLKSKQAVVIADLHFPFYDAPTFNAILDFIKQSKPDFCILLGDQLDLESISHWSQGKPLFRPVGGLKSDLDGFKSKILDPLQSALPRTCKKVWLEGNHERFITDLIEQQPELQGIVDHISYLKLHERGWQVIPLNGSFKLGKLTLIHGNQLQGGMGYIGNQPSKKAVDIYATSVLCGHTHSAQSYTRVSPADQHQKWAGYISPVAGNQNPRFMRNKPNANTTGLSIVELRPNGNFNCYLCLTVDGEFSYGSKTYGKRANIHLKGSKF
jgi:predicted phosphodiesterase